LLRETFPAAVSEETRAAGNDNDNDEDGSEVVCAGADAVGAETVGEMSGAETAGVSTIEAADGSFATGGA
jgi:uncharacterized protein YsxB (DUF464 family)